MLGRTLEDFLLPPETSYYRTASIPAGRYLKLPMGHHLVYFPPLTPLSHLLPDGTDPGQSPGGPFVHRLWAGGSIRFKPPPSYIYLRKQLGVALERIVDVVVKGSLGDEKAVVTVERRISVFCRHWFPAPQVEAWNEDKDVERSQHFEQKVREKLMDDELCDTIERRNIIFLQKPINRNASGTATKILKPPHKPIFSHVITPTAALLFRFSAMTFNAHRIHLDKQYCQEVEGHRNLLVHGPLSVVLMLEALRRFVRTYKEYLPNGWFHELEYRNLAPLYVDEEMKICGRQVNGKDWEVWIEGPDGGYAVKGVVRTMSRADLPQEGSEKSDDKGPSLPNARTEEMI